MDIGKYKYIVVGTGFSGSVVAERISSVLNEKVLVVERRSHIGGNSFSRKDPETGIDVHMYGSHIFHTDDKEVWDYVNRFSEFSQYQHKAVLISGKDSFFMPINLDTINRVFMTRMNPSQAEEFIANLSDIESKGEDPENVRGFAISRIGKELYQRCIYGYTRKQWNQEPENLPAKILKRIPIRFNYDTNYYYDRYQGIPKDGYGELIARILSGNNIDVVTGVDFGEIRKSVRKDQKIIYSGQIDEYFGYRFGPLEWRGLDFRFEKKDVKDFQGNSIVNYGDLDVPYTRIHEFKHYQAHEKVVMETGKTIVCYEFPKDWKPGEDAFYPVENKENIERLGKYKELGKTEKNVTFIGRLGTYRYLDMDDAIFEGLKISKETISTYQTT